MTPDPFSLLLSGRGDVQRFTPFGVPQGVPPQPSVVQSIGYTGAAGRYYIIIGTTDNGVRICPAP